MLLVRVFRQCWLTALFFLFFFFAFRVQISDESFLVIPSEQSAERFLGGDKSHGRDLHVDLTLRRRTQILTEHLFILFAYL